jgi:hypothetical protein
VLFRSCDFCKEPFGGKPAAAKASPAKEISKQVLAKAATDDKVAQQLLCLDNAEKVPSVPGWLRPAAWALITIIVIGTMCLLAIFMAKQSAWEDQAAQQRRFQRQP